MDYVWVDIVPGLFTTDIVVFELVVGRGRGNRFSLPSTMAKCGVIPWPSKIDVVASPTVTNNSTSFMARNSRTRRGLSPGIKPPNGRLRRTRSCLGAKYIVMGRRPAAPLSN